MNAGRATRLGQFSSILFPIACVNVFSLRQPRKKEWMISKASLIYRFLSLSDFPWRRTNFYENGLKQ